MIYLDNASTTKLSEAARKAIVKYIDIFGNPSSSYELGRESRLLIEDARARIAQCINAEPDEIYFTSGGSEANTWAIRRRYSLATTYPSELIYRFWPKRNSRLSIPGSVLLGDSNAK